MFTQNFPPQAADILTSTLKEQTQKQHCFPFLKRHSRGLMTIISNISTSNIIIINYSLSMSSQLRSFTIWAGIKVVLLVPCISKSIPQVLEVQPERSKWTSFVAKMSPREREMKRSINYNCQGGRFREYLLLLQMWQILQTNTDSYLRIFISIELCAMVGYFENSINR